MHAGMISAGHHGRWDVVGDLVARYNAMEKGLKVAAELGHVECIQHHMRTDDPLLSSGVLLEHACIGGQDTVCRYLLEMCKAQIGSDGGGVALLNAARNGHASTLKLLLDHGANPHFEQSGTTALNFAAGNGHVEVIRLLLSSEEPSSQRAVMALVSAASHGYFSAVRMFVEFGTAINSRCVGPLARTPINAAASLGHLEICQYLVEQKADVNVVSAPHGYSTLMIASHEGYVDLVKLLLANGADVNYQIMNEGGGQQNALKWALRTGRADIAQLVEF